MNLSFIGTKVSAIGWVFPGASNLQGFFAWQTCRLPLWLSDGEAEPK